MKKQTKYSSLFEIFSIRIQSS